MGARGVHDGSSSVLNLSYGLFYLRTAHLYRRRLGRIPSEKFLDGRFFYRSEREGYLLGTVENGSIQFEFQEVGESDVPQAARQQYPRTLIS